MQKFILLLLCIMSLAILPACCGNKACKSTTCTQETQEVKKHKEIGLDD